MSAWTKVNRPGEPLTSRTRAAWRASARASTTTDPSNPARGPSTATSNSRPITAPSMRSRSTGSGRRERRCPITSRTLSGIPATLAPERPAVSLLDQFARFDEVPQELPHEERAAVGLRVHGVGQGEFAALEVVAGQGLHHGHGLAVGEAPQAEPLDAGLPAKLGQQLGERMVPADVGVAVGPDDEQGHRLAGADQVFEQQQRGLGGPVEVVEQEHDRPPACNWPGHVDDGGEEQIALGLGVGPLRRREAGHPAG